MKSTLLIPQKLKIGFQKRSDTFTGKLAYIIYYDGQNVLRKEGSWNSWIDPKLPILEIDNVPKVGFVLNKGVQRYGDWGNSGRSVVRVYDDRDFEFEISIDNLMGILMHSDVSKRDIQESCVFAWEGQQLVLLPTNSEEYQQSLVYTAKQNQKVGIKDLVEGYTYSAKKSDALFTYIGYHEWFDWKEEYNPRTGRWMKKTHISKGKKHVFYDGKSFSHTMMTHLSSASSTQIHPNYATMVDRYLGSYHGRALTNPITA